MLKYLKISNIALIDELKVEFNKGLCVLSGETGAGKSIIIDALSFVLGGKFDKTLIRQGEESASVSAFFEDVSSESKAILEELGLDSSNEILLYRKAGSEKNEAKINGETITLSMLKQVASSLVDIHGQNENQRVLNVKNQLEVLDGFCGEQAANLKNEISNLYSNLLGVKAKIKDVGGSANDRERTLEFLKYQVKEIEDARIKDNEDEELFATKQRMLAGEKISDSLTNSLSVLNGAANINLILSEAISSLSNVSGFDEKLADLLNRLKSSKIEIDDIVEELDDYKNNLDFNEFEFNKIDSRLDLIKTLKKKYGSNTTEIKSFCDSAKQQIDEIENSEEILKKLEKEKIEIEKNLLVISSKLSTLRKEKALLLEQQICEELSSLAMKNAKFKIDFKQCDFSRIGTDEIEFLFSANAGQDLKPLGKIISGGEMSRFCLSLKNITFKNDKIATMVFDEVDTGISGKVAEVVAEKMVIISRNKQVLAITHLPQIVAMADCSLLIKKQEENQKTITSVNVLSKEQHADEVARLIGSNMSSLHATQHAKDLIDFGVNFKNELDVRINN